MRNFKLSLKSDTDQRPGKTATIQKNAYNPILAATEIRTLREEVRSLRSQVARSVLSADLDRNGKLLPHQKSNHVPYYLFIMIIHLGNMYYGVADTFLT
jgi:hypothetical protein